MGKARRFDYPALNHPPFMITQVHTPPTLHPTPPISSSPELKNLGALIIRIRFWSPLIRIRSP